MKYEVILWKRGSGANMRSEAIVEARTTTEAKEHAQAQYGSVYDVRHVRQLPEPEQTTRTLVAGLAGMAIGGAISKSRQQKGSRRQEEANRRAQWEERRARREAERTARAAARHVITLDAQCLNCGEIISASMASDGRTKVVCPQCSVRLRVDYDGDVTILGPKDAPLSKAEDLSITEDRLCSRCRYYRPKWNRILKYYAFWLVLLGAFYFYGWQAGWIHAYWKIVGTIACVLILGAVAFAHIMFVAFDDDICANRDARSVTNQKDAHRINPNLRCRFWAARK